jgi:hypothetical protein
MFGKGADARNAQPRLETFQERRAVFREIRHVLYSSGAKLLRRTDFELVERLQN